MIAARERLSHQCPVWRSHVELVDQSVGVLVNLIKFKSDALRKRRLIVGAQNQVIGDRERQDQPVALPILGDVGHAQLGDLAWRCICHFLTQYADVAAGGRMEAGQHLYQLCLAVALDASNAQHLARPHEQINVVQYGVMADVLRLQVRDLQHLLLWRGNSLLHDQRNLTPDHHLCQLFFRGLLRRGLAHELAIPQYDDAVGDRHHLFQFVADENYRLALSHQSPHDLEQLFGFLRCKHGCGFVQDENVGFAVKGLDDLDALLDAYREILGQRPWVHGQAILLRKLANSLSGGAPIERCGENP